MQQSQNKKSWKNESEVSVRTRQLKIQKPQTPPFQGMPYEWNDPRFAMHNPFRDERHQFTEKGWNEVLKAHQNAQPLKDLLGKRNNMIHIKKMNEKGKHKE